MKWMKQKIKILRTPVNSFLLICFIILYFLNQSEGKTVTVQNISDVAVDPKYLWPFNNDENCDLIQTRHIVKKSHRRKNKALEVNGHECGLNKFSDQFKKYHKLAAVSTTRKHTKSTNRGRKRKHRTAIVSGNKRHRSQRSTNSVKRRLDMENRIIGGSQAAEATWPWIVAIGESSKGLSCGGSIINEQWVISAAHCFPESLYPCQYNIRAGTNYWLSDWQQTSVDSIAENIFIHPNYDAKSMVNDIALVKLKTTLKLDKDGYINSICIPNTAQSVDVGEATQAAGWGVIDADSTVVPNELYEVTLTVYDYQGTCVLNPVNMANGTVCAGYNKGGKDTCMGDSGGPLAYTKNNRLYILGLTSWGFGCGQTLLPGMYTDVAYFKDWITSTINTYS